MANQLSKMAATIIGSKASYRLETLKLYVESREPAMLAVKNNRADQPVQ